MSGHPVATLTVDAYDTAVLLNSLNEYAHHCARTMAEAGLGVDSVHGAQWEHARGLMDRLQWECRSLLRPTIEEAKVIA